MKRKIFYTMIRTIRRLKDPYYQGAAAEMGFYFIFSIIPIMILLVQVLSLFDRADLLFAQILERFANNEAASAVLSAVSSSSSTKFSLAFLIVVLWSASKIEFSLIRLSDYSYKTDLSGKSTGYVKLRLRAIVTILCLVLMVVASLLVLVYGNLLLNLADSLLREVLGIELEISRLFFILRWPAALVIYWFFLAINYAFLPGKRISVKKVIPGSLFAAVGILAATGGYYIYFEYFSNLNMVYGSLAAVIALLLWFYLLSYILLIGLIINVIWFEDGRNINELW